jgi:hypothetical protein
MRDDVDLQSGIFRPRRAAGAGMDAPSIRGILAGKFETEAARSAGDQNGRHVVRNSLIVGSPC